MHRREGRDHDLSAVHDRTRVPGERVAQAERARRLGHRGRVEGRSRSTRAVARALIMLGDAYASRRTDSQPRRRSVDQVDRRVPEGCAARVHRREQDRTERRGSRAPSRSSLPAVDSTPAIPTSCTSSGSSCSPPRIAQRPTAAGEQMIKTDTALADTTFFLRQAACYALIQRSAEGGGDGCPGRREVQEQRGALVALRADAASVRTAAAVARRRANRGQARSEDRAWLPAHRAGADRSESAGQRDRDAQAGGRDRRGQRRRSVSSCSCWATRRTRTRPTPRIAPQAEYSRVPERYRSTRCRRQHLADAASQVRARRLRVPSRRLAVRENQNDKKCDLAKTGAGRFLTAQINIAAGWLRSMPKTAQPALVRARAVLGRRSSTGEEVLQVGDVPTHTMRPPMFGGRFVVSRLALTRAAVRR